MRLHPARSNLRDCAGETSILFVEEVRERIYRADRMFTQHVIGLGRHALGSNVFWYVKDPCGTMSEFYCDMDCIPDQAEWERRKGAAPPALGVWGPHAPPEVFFAPADLETIAKGREAERR